METFFNYTLHYGLPKYFVKKCSFFNERTFYRCNIFIISFQTFYKLQLKSLFKTKTPHAIIDPSPLCCIEKIYYKLFGMANSSENYLNNQGQTNSSRQTTLLASTFQYHMYV